MSPDPERTSAPGAVAQASADAAPAPDAGRPVLPGPVQPEPVQPEPVLPEQSREDTDTAWGEYPEHHETENDRLYRDRPPHWDDY
jgi:hypothetical protein